MALTNYLTRHATIEQWVTTDDLAGGQTGVWTARGYTTIYLTTVKSSVAMTYKREGYTNVVRMQTQDSLPRRLLTYKFLSEFLRANDQNRVRFLIQGRTLHPISFRQQAENRVALPILTLDCSETAPKVGYVDFVS